MNGDEQNEGRRQALDLELARQRALSAIGALEWTGQDGGVGRRLRSSVEEVPVLEVECPRPWDVLVWDDSGTWKVTFYRCFIKRSGLCALVSDQTFELPTDLATGSYYIGVRVTLADNALSLLSGANLSDVAYTTLPSGSDQDYGRIPLYVLAYVAGDSPTWSVLYDLRSIPDLGVYL